MAAVNSTFAHTLLAPSFQATARGFVDLLVYALQERLVDFDHAALFLLGGDLRSNVWHIGLEFEASEVGHVVEGNLAHVEQELALGVAAAERSIAKANALVDLELALVALLFEAFLRLEPHSVGVLVHVFLAQLEGIEPVLAPEARDASRGGESEGHGIN